MTLFSAHLSENAKILAALKGAAYFGVRMGEHIALAESHFVIYPTQNLQ